MLSTPVAAAVVLHGGRLLLLRRAVAEGALSWQLPAGKLEPGESAEQAAVREAYEETGLTVQVTMRLGERVHPLTQRPMSYWACHLVSGTAHAASRAEVAEVAWCGAADLRSRVPSGLYGPVQAYVDSALAP